MENNGDPLSAAQDAFKSLKYSGLTPLKDFLKVFEDSVAAVRAAGGTVNDEQMIEQLLIAMPASFGSAVTALDFFFHIEKPYLPLTLVIKVLLIEEGRLRAEAASGIGPSNYGFNGLK